MSRCTTRAGVDWRAHSMYRPKANASEETKFRLLIVITYLLFITRLAPPCVCLFPSLFSSSLLPRHPPPHHSPSSGEIFRSQQEMWHIFFSSLPRSVQGCFVFGRSVGLARSATTPTPAGPLLTRLFSPFGVTPLLSSVLAAYRVGGGFLRQPGPPVYKTNREISLAQFVNVQMRAAESLFCVSKQILVLVLLNSVACFSFLQGVPVIVLARASPHLCRACLL